MSKKTGIEKVESNTIVINDVQAFSKHLSDVTKAITKPIEITSASLKEELCNYGYEIKTGPCAGDKIPNRKGSSIVHEDMINAFAGLSIHLAVIDDAFKQVYETLPETSLLKEHEIAAAFTVTGFKIHGSDENEGYVLIGEKYVTHGSIGLETPKISKGSGYPFFEELQEAIEGARSEVEQYMNGKAAPKLEQGALPFGDAATDDAFSNPMQ